VFRAACFHLRKWPRRSRGEKEKTGHFSLRFRSGERGEFALRTAMIGACAEPRCVFRNCNRENAANAPL